MDNKKIQDIYTKLNAVTYLDILRHFPKRYDSLVLSELPEMLQENSKLVLHGKFTSLVSIKHGSIIRLSLNVNNYNEIVTGVIFNQPFYQRMLKRDQEYFFFGTYRSKQKAVMISSIISASNKLVANPYKPYYQLPSSISQSNFYNLINEILLTDKDYIFPILPKKYIERYRLENIYQAFVDVHCPYSIPTIERGLRVFKYEEALKYSLLGLKRKEEQSKIKKREMNPIDKIKINQFISHLPYTLTKDQVNAVREIVLDMDNSKVMNRMLQGDVGSGKTIVAFISLYANYLRQGQGVILAPTQTLASQHYHNALEVFKNYNLRIALLDNSLSSKEARVILKGIEKGEYDIVIGTHSLFSKNVEYNNLSLAIIDEQHKFGVIQREALLSKGQGVDTLMMTATPIPQTLCKIIVSDLEVTSLKEFPFKERQVVTKRVTSDDPMIKKAILHALEVKKQVYIVAPKIEKSETSSKLSAKAIYQEMCEKYGEENVALLTGATIKGEQEKVYNQFKEGKKLILVATSLIEVGVDVKNASLMIIYEANFFGLASLHQLRGRIGRSGQGALALLVYDGDDQEAQDKLDYLASTNDGEKISLYDLSHRGGGDLFSQRQSGSSILQVANFVQDEKIFACAKDDAQEILSSLDQKENKMFYQTCLLEEEKRKNQL